MRILNKDVVATTGLKVKHRHTGTEAVVTKVLQIKEKGTMVEVSTYFEAVIPELFEVI